MPRYFFDTRTDDRVVTDEEGIVLSDLHAARAQATEALADMANDVIPSERAQTLSVEVRDEEGTPVLKACVWSEVQVLT